MAADPKFASVARIGVGAVSVANAGRDGSGTLVLVINGAAAGTKVFEVRVVATGDPADSIVTLFLKNGANTATFFDSVDIGNPNAASVTTTAIDLAIQYRNLVLPDANWSLQAAITVAPTAGVVNVYAFAGDLT